MVNTHICVHGDLLKKHYFYFYYDIYNKIIVWIKTL